MSPRPVFCALLAFGLVACAPEVGDECKTALDCSSQGSRLCDRTQPGGYCTIRGCEPGTCPEEAVCVKFRPAEERLAVTYCMRKCDDNGDCRNDEDYRCLSAEAFGLMEEAEILGSGSQRFCSVPMLTPDVEPLPPPNMSMADASASPVTDASSDGGVDAGRASDERDL